MVAAHQGFALVTPASRGLGFAIARQLLVRTSLPVIATARKNSNEVHDRLLEGLPSQSGANRRLRVYDVDVTDESTISSMAYRIQREYPDTLLRLALTIPGILHVEKAPNQIDRDKALESFTVNSLGPLLLIKHLAPFLPTKAAAPFPVSRCEQVTGQEPFELPSHAIYAMMAARVGSVSDNATGGWYSYRASKSAVFQLAKTFDLHLQTRSAERALALALHPGTVHTDFTRQYWGHREMLEPGESAERLLRFITKMGPGANDGRGRCWDWKGEEIRP